VYPQETVITPHVLSNRTILMDGETMNTDRIGHIVPDVTFHTRSEHDWVDVTSADLFAGRTVVVFSLPGAFTPTCSSSHVPRYNHLADAFREAGVDEIICVSVNDAFVMNEWQRQQGAEKLRFIPDGNGEFTAGMGMLVEKSALGFGERSWRYSMLVHDGVVQQMFVEPDVPGDPYGISDADTMFAYVAPNATKPSDVTVFSRPGCPFCADAKDQLERAGISFEELVLNRDYHDSTLRAVAGQTSVPQIFVNGARIGGAEQLSDWLGLRTAA
jgi:glutathione amide-dependent peroxidase